MVNVKTPEPGVTLVATDVDSLDSSSSTADTVVLGFANGGYLPLVATAYALDHCHVDTIAKGPGFPRPLAEGV
jgi:hypothetical protein